LPPREQVRAFRKQLILEAAEGVFAAHGFEGASVEEIASGADVAIATLYKVFGGKEAIFTALVEHRQDQFLIEVESSARENTDPRVQLERLTEAIFGYFEKHQQAFHIYLGATHGFPWRIRSSFGERTFQKYREFLTFLSTLLRAGIKAGAWPDADPQRLAAAVMGCINGLLTRRHTEQPRLPLRDDIEFATSVVSRLVGRATRSGRRR
jgi:AcrR family transcriptional regulator